MRLHLGLDFGLGLVNKLTFKFGNDIKLIKTCGLEFVINKFNEYAPRKV